MEAGVARKQLLLVLAIVLLIRVPFLNQAIQGDDHIYLSEGQHAQIDPLHPMNMKYVFMGDEVDLRGHSHPPLNGWVLGALIAAFGDIYEVPFHAAYIVFSLIAAVSMWSLAQRFSPQPLWAALLFLAVPAFVVNGSSLEADLPFLAFWMAAIALFCAGRLVLAALAMTLAALVAYQAVMLTPILAVYCWLYHRRDRARWLIILVPPAATVAWQIFEGSTTGATPVSVMVGYFAQYGFQGIERKLRSALGLNIHLWFIVFPALVPPAIVMAWRKRREPDTLFLLAWIAIFFAGGIVVFFAGSARYLLPMAAPVALLASRLGARWLAIGFAAQMALGLGLATVNYQHWDGFRQFAAALRAKTVGHRVWVDDGWGLRYYLESDGALPARKTTRLRAGDIVVAGQLGSSVRFTAPLTPIAKMEIRPAIPLRLIGVESQSAYSDVSKGFWPFGISTGAIDRVSAAMVRERHPTLEYLPLNAPEAAEQIVSGIDPADHWMSKNGFVAVRNPSAPKKVRVMLYIPPQARARHISVLLDGREVASQTYGSAGPYTLESSQAVRGTGESAVLEINVDRTFFAPGDRRELGIVLIGVGFVE